jgi:CheY-like chemotaxis protein
MLGVIIGYTQLLQEKISSEDGAQEKLAEVKRAADRAAALTRQLLAFSRKQVLQPRILEVNSIVNDLTKMLRRMIGDDIQLVIRPSASLGMIMADPSQLEQVLMNLAVNARDAMPHGGKLLVETSNVKLDESYALEHRPIVPGDYVMLAVSDSGCGMDAQTQAHIFEPFFTTKEEGKGTGLGLSTVYGVVKQSGGYIWVYSELGIGTTFKIYFPRVKREQVVVHETPAFSASSPALSSITILLVEDEDSMRQLARGLLESNGFTVLDASNGTEALKIAQQYPEKIHLLLTDVIMPGMSGSELAKHMQVVRPGLHVLYMSGYTDDMIAHQGVLESGLTLLEKPFSKEALMMKVREALDKVPMMWQ